MRDPEGSAKITTHSLAIKWLAGEAGGWINVFPAFLFKSPGTTACIHPVLAPNGRRYRSKCDIAVSADSADLNYEAYPDYNERREMELGVTRLVFSNARREEIVDVLWRWKGEKLFRSGLAEVVESPIGEPSAYRRKRDNKRKEQRDIAVRDEQARFKENLMFSHGYKCCITGCTVDTVLDAAHIDAYNGPSSNHVENGLLLRRDLHALFDADLLGIEPESMKVHINPEVRSEHSEYNALEGKRLLLPHTGSGMPARDPLSRRWKKFQKANAGG